MTREEIIGKFEYDVARYNRAMRFLIVLDQMLNVVLWNGSQDETISSHIGRRIESGEANLIDKALCKFLRLLENRHCIESIGE